jgi:hypothetical protein
MRLLEFLLEEMDNDQLIDARDRFGAFPSERRAAPVMVQGLTLGQSRKNSVQVATLERLALEQTTRTTSSHDLEFAKMKYKMFILAAVKIQAMYRGWWVRDSLFVDHYCAATVQRTVRGYLCRVRYHFDLYRIILIQAFVRMARARAVVAQMMSCIISIQAYTRGFLLRKSIHAFSTEHDHNEVDEDANHDCDESLHNIVARDELEYHAINDFENSELKNTSLDYSDELHLDEYEFIAATIIQAFWRSYDCQISFLHTMADVLIVQSVVRRWLALKVVASMRVPALDTADRHQVVAGCAKVVPQTNKRWVVARPAPGEATARTYNRPGVARCDVNEVGQGKCNAVVERPDTRDLARSGALGVEPAYTSGQEIVDGVKSNNGAHQHQNKVDPVIGIISEGGTKEIMNAWKQRDAASRDNAFRKKPHGKGDAPS